MTIITPILQMRTLRPRKVALAAPGHKVSEWWILSHWTAGSLLCRYLSSYCALGLSTDHWTGVSLYVDRPGARV